MPALLAIWLFAIREETGRAARLLLAGLFCVILFALWIFATDNPRWLNALIVQVLPRYELKVGDAVNLEIDRAEAQLEISKAATGRTIVRQLPPIAADALPELRPAHYPGLFAELTQRGLGDFQPTGAYAGTVAVADAERAADRMRGVGPQPFQLPLTKGEEVHIGVDFFGKSAAFSIERVTGRVRVQLSELPEEGERFPPRLERYPQVLEAAGKVGVGAVEVDPAHETGDAQRMFRGVVVDPEAAKRMGLGPRRTIAPLREGERIGVELVRAGAPPLEHEVVLRCERTRKEDRLRLLTAWLDPAAIPELSLEHYPTLAERIRDDGVTVTSTPSGLSAEVSGHTIEIAMRGQQHARTWLAAELAGLGLYKPSEERVLPRQTMPSPTEVVESVPELWHERRLAEGTWVTLKRIFKGFGWGVLVTLPLGLLMGAFGRIASFFEPLRLAGMYVPLPALIPLTIAWSSLGEPQVVLFLAICNGVVLLPFVVASIQSVPQVYIDTARTLGATRGQLFRYVLLAISWPTLFKGLRISFAVGWTWMMLAEMNGVDQGLGYIINVSQKRGMVEHVMIVIVLVVALAFVCNTIWNLLIRVLFPYERGQS